jgi:hypothetical protein
VEKRPKDILRKKSTRGFFGFESSFQYCFWNVLSTSGMSQICKIRNICRLPSPFSRNTLIPCSDKSSLSLKTSFWKKNYPTNSKIEFIGQFFFQNNVFKHKEYFSEHAIRVFLEKSLKTFRHLLFYRFETNQMC